jgi:cytochrome b6-f complex iron-sulfur subunit
LRWRQFFSTLITPNAPFLSRNDTEQELLMSELTRRDFMRLTALGCTALCGLAGCAKDEATGEAATSAKPVVKAEKNADGTFVVKGGGKLAAGKALAFSLPDGAPAILLATATGEITALSAECTHAGCEVAWREKERHLHCPCHNSEFSADGKVLSGPAKKPLPRYEARISGDNAVVSLKA